MPKKAQPRKTRYVLRRKIPDPAYPPVETVRARAHTRSDGQRELTPLGKKFLDATRPARFPILFQAVAGTPVFREAIRRNLEGKPMPVGEIAELILAKEYSNRTTANRRAQTVVSWLIWLWREHANLKA